MTDSEIKIYEQYLFSPEKEAFLSKLILGSDEYYFFNLLHAMNTYGLDLPPQSLRDLEHFKLKRTPRALNISLRFSFMQLANPKIDQELKKIILQELNENFLDLNFNYQKGFETFKQEAATKCLKNDVVSNVLDEKLLEIEETLAKIYKDDENALDSLEKPAFRLIDLKKLSRSDKPNIGIAFLKLAPLAELEGIENFVCQFLNKNPTFEVKQTHLKKMTIEQMKKIQSLKPELIKNTEFVGVLFQKEFEIEAQSKRQSFNSPEQKKARQTKLLKMSSWIKETPHKNQCIVSYFLFEYLHIGLQLNELNFDVFVEYLHNPKGVYSRANTQIREEISKSKSKNSNESFWRELAECNSDSGCSDDELISTYLEKYFQINKKIEPFDEFFEHEYLTQLFHKVKLYSGEQVENVADILPPHVLQRVSQEKQLTLCKFNPENFTDSQQVVLFLEVKNIANLTVKVFENSTEDYYLKKGCDVTAEVNVEGLIANEEIFFEFSDPPQKKSIKEFKFPSLSQKSRGVFIVDFLGNGISSRAFLRKGKLTLIEKRTLSGQIFTIFDERMEVCSFKKGRTGLWVKGRFYEADEQGHVSLPFSKSSEGSVPAVIVHGSFASLTKIDLIEESYHFKCCYLYKDESLLMGNKLNLLIQPRLYLNQQPMNLDVIENQVVKVITRADQDNIPSTIVFDKVRLDYKQELEIEIPIPAKLNSISIEVKGKIKKMVASPSDQEISCRSTHEININNSFNSDKFSELFLRLSSGDFEVYVLGKTGEPKKNILINIELAHRYLKIPIKTQLQTDSEGKVSLGKLKDIISVKATSIQKGDIKPHSRTWIIEKKGKTNYPNHIDVCLGEECSFPYFEKELNSEHLSFLRVIEDKSEGFNVLSDRFMDLDLKRDQRKLTVKALTPGKYILSFQEQKQQVVINVREGRFLKTPKMILTDNKLIKKSQDSSTLVIKNIELKDNQNLSFAIESSDFKTTRIHVLAYTFLNDTLDRYYNLIKQNIELESNQTITLHQESNQYLSNKTLSGESCYVLNRKKEERHVGNTLEKPQILLKRTFLRDTTLEKEELESETAYRERNKEKKERDYSGSESSEDEIQASRKRKKMVKGEKIKKVKRTNEQCRDESSPAKSEASEQNSSLLNFLQNPCKIIPNLKPNTEGKILLENLGLEAYSTVEIIATSINTVVREIFPLKKRDLKTKDLRQGSSEDGSKKYYSIFRNVHTRLINEKIVVEDMTSTKIKIIDSLSKVFDLQLEILKVMGRSQNENGKNYEDWRFVTNWAYLKMEEKQLKYDEYSSHEMNLFLFFKDRAYFDNFVKPFIANKLEKTFVDYFLLEDAEKLSEFNNIGFLSKLNAMEKVLLMFFLLQEKRLSEAESIAHYLEIENKTKIYDQNTFQILFDTILGSKLSPSDVVQPPQPPQNDFECMNSPPIEEFYGFESMNYCLAATPKEEFCCNEEANMALYDCPRAECCEMDCMDMEAEEGSFFEDQEFIEKRKQYIQNFQNLEPTKEYVETSYFNMKNSKDNTFLISNDAFWTELAHHLTQKDAKKPFLSTNFIYSTTFQAAMILTLAFLGLPFSSASHNYLNLQGKVLEITPTSNCIVFLKEIKEAKTDLRPELIVTQRFFDPSDRFRFNEDEMDVKYEKEVEDFIIDKIYGGEIILTNLSITRQEFQVLYEIPEGSIPVRINDYKKSSNIQIDAFTTQKLEFFFYFPWNGKFSCSPASLSKKGAVVAVAKDRLFEVFNEHPNTKKMETMQQILSQGSKEDILNFVASKNILNSQVFNFADILYLLKDEDFYLKMLEILRKRRVFNEQVWSFSVIHADLQGLKEYLGDTSMQTLFETYLNYFCNDLLIVRKGRLLEYSPLVNARVHQLSQEKDNILNLELKSQYKAFLEYLVEVPKPGCEDLLAFTYYLLLQDRINESIQIYQQIDQKEVEKKGKTCQLQYDYFTGFLDFYIGYPNFKRAREVCEKYLDYPVLSWRNLFYEIANQLAEYDGEELVDDREVSKEKKLTEKQQNLKGAKTEELLNLEVNEHNIVINSRNCSEVTISYYLIDVEALFSRNPFLLQGSDDFGYIFPNRTEMAPLEETGKTVWKIPEDLTKSNIFIQVKGKTKISSLTYFSTSLKVHIIEAYAQIKVTDSSNKPISQVYVKVFSKSKSGESSFYKDGYTDLRGRFDYAALHAESLNNVEKFSIFIMCDKLGSLIKEAMPPSSLGKIGRDVALKSGNWSKKANERKEQTYQNYILEKKKPSKQ